MKPKLHSDQIATALLLMILAFAGTVSAATLTWTNTAGGDWATAGNWSPNAIPGSGDTTVISGTDALTIVLTGFRSVNTLVLEPVMHFD